MKKLLIFFVAILGMVAASSEVLAQTQEGIETKGCPDGFTVTFNGNVISMNCDFCMQNGLPQLNPQYHCEVLPGGHTAVKPGVCLTCFVVYDNITRGDQIVDIIKIPALQRAWVLEQVNSGNQGEPIIVTIGEEIDINELILLLQNQP